MPIITTAEEAIEAGNTFLNKYYNFTRPMTAKKTDRTWELVFDVGVFKPQKISLIIDSESGSIVELDELSEK